VVVVAGPVDMTVGTIERYDASALANNDIVFRLPAAPAKDDEAGIKEVGDSTVFVTIDGNGNQVESASASPAPTQSTNIARQSLTLKFDGVDTWWVV
jgi:hypothetical protein